MLQQYHNYNLKVYKATTSKFIENQKIWKMFNKQ